MNDTGGNPTIYLEGASINVSDGPAISIIGGTPTIHVIGEGNSTADVLTANGGVSNQSHPTYGTAGAGIGSSSNGLCGDITIENAVVNATGGYASAAIGMGCNFYISPSIGDITITNSNVTATSGYYAATIGYSLCFTNSGGGTYCFGKITITTDE